MEHLRLPGGVIVTGVGTITGDLSVSGTLTYEDVTNIDSVGIVTARQGIKIGPLLVLLERLLPMVVM